ncbi:MAG: hypothetical protein LAQ30_07235 [Acidobacteriia bacterium]|nr:hypothetical protein [Terriglobia bacterium]
MTAAVDFGITADLRSRMRSWRTRSGIVGIIALVALIVGAFFEPHQFFRSYLWAYVFYVGVAVGCLAWLMTQYLSGGAWGVVVRRPCEAAARTIPLLAVLFVPIAFGLSALYLWHHPDAVAKDEILRHKQVYLNTPFFLIRTAAYFAGWIIFEWLLNYWSAKEDRGDTDWPHKRMARLSAPGLVFWGFSITFMAIDWVLSIEPHWFSTMFGMLFMAGQGLSSMAFLITLMVLLSYVPPMSEILTPRHLHDLGKLLLANVMVWAYFSFSQLLIIWAGNLPHEIPWYLERLRGGWQFIGLALIFLHFAVPFALLLSRDLKRNFKFLAGIAIFILFMRYVDIFWLVAPSFRKGAFGMSWMDFAAPIGLGGIWLAYFLMQLEKRPLMPLHDVHLEEALEHGRE